MCQGGIDPKYGLRDLERQVRAARQSIGQGQERRAPVPLRFGGAWLARVWRAVSGRLAKRISA